MTEPVSLSDAVCQMCGTRISGNAIHCPGCGEVRLALPRPTLPPPAIPGDIIFAVVLGLIGLGLTLPADYGLTMAVIDGPSWDLPFVGLFVGLWNLMIWGVPALVVGRQWWLATKRGDVDKTHLWRTYWKTQIATYGGIVALAILMLTICAAAM
jgi:hypothetical protein